MGGCCLPDGVADPLSLVVQPDAPDAAESEVHVHGVEDVGGGADDA